MAEAPELAPDVLEQVLIGFKVKDLIRLKSVCKSWHSFISSSRFVDAHLKHSYQNDRDNKELGNRRIVMSEFFRPYEYCKNVNDDYEFMFHKSRIFGSANGLVCIYSQAGIFVANPLTRDAIKLQHRPRYVFGHSQFDLLISDDFCWGFGYDSSTDDYKVVLGRQHGCQTSFQVFCLKANVWRVIKSVKYYYDTKSGILCNGKLHWFMIDINNKPVIVSFDLIKEEWKEIPQPDHPRYYYYICSSRLGIVEECLCIIQGNFRASKKWVLKNYNVEQSWELFQYDDSEKKNDVAHYLRNLKFYDRVTKSYFQDDTKLSRTGEEYLDAPIFVPSLVSPIINARPKRKRLAKNSNKNVKFIKEDLSGPNVYVYTMLFV